MGHGRPAGASATRETWTLGACRRKGLGPYSLDQQLLLPLPSDLRGWLPEGDLALFVSDVVDELDLSAIYAACDSGEGWGQPPYHPAMVKLPLYGYCIGTAARTWRRKRRVIIKAEVVRHPGRDPKNNPRFVVTNFPDDPQTVYERIYCQRGTLENRLKEHRHVPRFVPAPEFPRIPKTLT